MLVCDYKLVIHTLLCLLKSTRHSASRDPYPTVGPMTTRVIGRDRHKLILITKIFFMASRNLVLNLVLQVTKLAPYELLDWHHMTHCNVVTMQASRLAPYRLLDWHRANF